MQRWLKSRRFSITAGLGLVLVAALVIGAVSVLGGDDESKGHVTEDPYPDNENFHTFANADPFAGGAPMKVNFEAKPFNQTGDVKYFWRFDDGTTSREQNPSHSFTQPGTYSVYLDSRDESGSRDRITLVLGAWPAKIWETSERRRLTRAEQLNAIRAQTKRTAARHARLKAEGKRDLIEPPPTAIGPPPEGQAQE